MSLTPVLKIDEEISLIPVNKSILSSVIEAYKEDPESALIALPWLNSHEEIRNQLRDMLFDVESQSDADQLHFWSIVIGTSATRCACFRDRGNAPDLPLH